MAKVEKLLEGLWDTRIGCVIAVVLGLAVNNFEKLLGLLLAACAAWALNAFFPLPIPAWSVYLVLGLALPALASICRSQADSRYWAKHGHVELTSARQD